jgi:hypothetical protein
MWQQWLHPFLQAALGLWASLNACDADWIKSQGFDPNEFRLQRPSTNLSVLRVELHDVFCCVEELRNIRALAHAHTPAWFTLLTLGPQFAGFAIHCCHMFPLTWTSD